MSFNVTIKCSGHSYTTAPGASVLQSGLNAGYMLPYNCRSGLCRMCKTRVLEGEIAYGDKPLDSYLSEKDRAEGFALLCQAHALSDLVIDADELVDLQSVRSRMVPCRIVGLDKAAPDVMIVKLRLPMNENMLYMAGQHISMILNEKVERMYSIANACRPEGVTELELHIRHLPGGAFTDRLFNEFKVRMLSRFEGPLGTFFIREHSAKPMIFLASGTGFAPIKAMMEDVINKGINKDRKVDFYWGARNRRDLYMYDLAQQWARDHTNIRFIPVLSEPTSECAWDGAVGFVHQQVISDHPDLSSHQIYACGAPVMVRAARNDFVAQCNADPKDFYADEFLSAADA
ncbi:CDP-6-deoxy-delta-3,4-glucoseen reductase [Paraburkholderia sediminicola]|uniref:CDP-6-deoxy-delta-3,4-glucoseen reductase n=1 Tax=Paraburkholderia sediminicola TaxID=458836 RepID=UPI0038B8BC09